LTPVSWYQNATVGASYAKGESLEVEADAVIAEENQITQQTDVTQFCKDALLDAGIIPMTNPYRLNCYWPWLENYYGEIDAGYHSQIPMIRELWINQSLKTSLR
jgi:peptide/nickel transport system substrate-binding protein